MSFDTCLAAINSVYEELKKQVKQLRAAPSDAQAQALRAMGASLDLVATIGAQFPGAEGVIRNITGNRGAVAALFKQRRACLLLLAGNANIAIALMAEDLLRVSKQDGHYVVSLVEGSPKPRVPVFTILARPAGAQPASARPAGAQPASARPAG
ncbi:MAG: hypothetical protein EBU46_17920, partial [Nitrosomonadaceae bacterium]|nr:hypothetical protein [Nitrosomonadaceae bacterium]